MFVDLDWPLNASSLLSASAELFVRLILPAGSGCVKHILAVFCLLRRGRFSGPRGGRHLSPINEKFNMAKGHTEFCVDLVIIISVNCDTYVLILTSKQLVPSPPSMFTLNLTIATIYILTFLIPKLNVFSTFKTSQLALLPRQQNSLMLHLFLNLLTGSKF